MQLIITGRHVDVTPALRDYVNDKMDRIIRHCDQLTEVRCILEVEKLRHKAEATLYVSGGTIFAEAVADDMYAAIDGLVDRLDRRVKKHKDKQNDHHVREAHRQRLA
ncbi:MAG: ribosome-associated translation inhibitor RaiA [Gammaproteobacteria bacterium]